MFFRFGAKVRKKFTLFYTCWAGRFQMKHDIILTDCIIPIGNYSLIHHFHIFKRSVTETNDIPMIKMGVRCKKTPCYHRVYSSFLLNLCASLHVNNPVTNSPSDGNGRGASQRQLSQMGITKKVGKFGKDSPTIQFLFSQSTIKYLLCSLESIYSTRFNA